MFLQKLCIILLITRSTVSFFPSSRYFMAADVARRSNRAQAPLSLMKLYRDSDGASSESGSRPRHFMEKFKSIACGLAISCGLIVTPIYTLDATGLLNVDAGRLLPLRSAMIPDAMAASVAADSGKDIGVCLLKQCRLELAKCATNPNCIANVACIKSCTGKPDEAACQIKCGDIFENDVVGEFNKCAISDRNCVPQRKDEGLYPVPSPDDVVKDFPTSLFNGKWYITAGQNPLFDIFPCQVHFFTETSPGKFFGKLNWRIEEPDGEFFNRDAIQEFVQDKKQPGHLINHDNEYLHYKDDWYIIDYEPDGGKDPAFAFVYYCGSNDAWDGYGGVFIYTRDAKFPEQLRPRMEAAAKKVGYDFNKDFTLTDNTCQVQSDKEKLVLREKFLGKAAIQTEEQLLRQLTLARGNAANSVKAQKIFFEGEGAAAQKAFESLNKNVEEFEKAAIGAK